MDIKIQIGTNVHALEDLTEKARTFCSSHGIDQKALLDDFRKAYHSFKGNLPLIYVNVLQGISHQILEWQDSGVVSPLTVDLLNNFYLALACIEEIHNEAQANNVIESLFHNEDDS